MEVMNGLHQTAHRSTNGSRKPLAALTEAVHNDCATIVHSGKSFYMRELEKGRKLFRRSRLVAADGDKAAVEAIQSQLSLMNEPVKCLLKDIGESGSRILCHEIRVWSQIEDDTIRGQDVQVLKVASGYVFGLAKPTVREYDVGLHKIFMRTNLSRRSQRFISSRNFYNSPLLRQDCVLLQASVPNRRGRMSLWVAKILGLFRVRKAVLSESGEGDWEMAFVQFFDVVRPDSEIDAVLGYIKLKWANGRSNEENEEIDNDGEAEGSTWLSLVPVLSVRGIVHVLRGDYVVKGNCIMAEMEDVPWQHQEFYINRFYFEAQGNEPQIPNLT